MTKKQFGLRLAKLRIMRNIPATELSLRLNCSRSYINGIENGKFYPRMDDFFKICKALDITPNEFYTQEVSITPKVKTLMPYIEELSEEKFDNLMLIIKALADQ